MSAPKLILDLIDRFHRNRDDYHAPTFNEANLRLQFIDPFFECLGWDMHNRQGHAEAYKDVIHEDALRIGSAVKAPDYCFRIGGARKFFLEAKKPAVNIKADPAPAFQLRRYGWSAKLPLNLWRGRHKPCILTTGASRSGESPPCGNCSHSFKTFRANSPASARKA